MRTALFAGALGMLVALSGCAIDDLPLVGSDDNKKMERLYDLTANDPTGALQACHWMGERLVGQKAAFFSILNNDDFVVLSWDGVVLCIDEPVAALRAGVIPMNRDDEPVCSFCGTPLPAEEVIERARRYTESQAEL